MSTPENDDSSPTGDLLSDHSYDGIQEFDNPTPGWWNMLFLATIVVSPIYAIWFHAPQMGRTHAAAYETALAENLKLQFGELGDLEPSEETLLRFVDDAQWLKVGQATFQTNCVSCHGKNGQGVSGPNLTDDKYLHVKTIADIASVVSNGAKGGAMPAWGNRLHPNEVVLVAAYVASLRGQNLPSDYNGQQGETIPPWPSAVAPPAGG